MRLITLSAIQVYGSLNLSLEFHSNLNLLVGINGSGKTTALNLIDWLLRPNLPKLSTQKFSEINLTFELNGKECEINCTKDSNHLHLLVRNANTEFSPIVVRRHPGDPNFEIEDFYRGLSAEQHEEEAWNFIHSIPKPTIVSLERTITAEVNREVYYDSSLRREKRIQNKQTPLSYIQELFSTKYADYRTIAKENDSQLKTQIFLTALHSPNTTEPYIPGLQFPQESTEQLEEKVIRYLTTSLPSGENVAEIVSSFFSYFRTLQNEIEMSPERSRKFVDLIQSQFTRVDQLARAFNEFEKKNAEAFKRLGHFLRLVNNFLADSGKRILVDDSRGKLAFQELNEKKPYGPLRPIDKLSSGETQIIILFALMAFEATPSSIFIIDEPELSLHPKWQNEFMNAILELRPNHSQFFVATHSPEIVAGRKSSCVFF